MCVDGIERRSIFLSFRFNILVRRVPLYPALRMLDFVLKQAKRIDVVQRLFRAIKLMCMT